jgi:hypothetical protein
MRGYILPAGEVKNNPATETKPKLTLQEMYKALDCDLVQVIEFPWGEMWVDEMFLMRNPPPLPNVAATRILVRTFFRSEVVIHGAAYIRVKSGYTLCKDGVRKNTLK